MTENPTENIVREWARSLQATLHSMTEREPKLTLGEATEILITAGEAEEIEWWVQAFEAPAGAEFWVGALARSWEALDWAVSPATSQDVLTQSLAGLGQGGELRKPEPGGSGGQPKCRAMATLRIELGAGNNPIELMAGASDALLGIESERVPESVGRGATDGLAEIRLPLRVVLGRASMTFGEICKLTAGSIVELDRKVNDPVEIVVKDDLVIARGQVVVSDGKYGARVTSIEANGSRASGDGHETVIAAGA